MAYGRFKKYRRTRRYGRRYPIWIGKSSRRTRLSRALNRRKWKRRFNRPSSLRVRKTLITDQVFVKLKYRTQQKLNATGIYDSWIVSGNNMYDPDFTGVGHQPTGFDQYSAFFNKYLVYGCKIKVTMQNNLTGTMVNAYIVPSDSGAPTWLGDGNYDPNDQPNTKQAILQGYSINPARSSCVLKHYMTTKKIWEDTQLDPNDYGAVTTTSPSKLWYFIIYNTVYQFNGGGTATSVTFATILDVKMTYYAKFFDRKFVIES